MKMVAAAVLLFLLLAGDAHAQQPINVTGSLLRSQSRELGFPGRAGNSLQEQWGLHDRYGRRVGQLLMTCRWITARQRYCGGVVDMPLGHLSFQGISASRLAGNYAITGGTERYAGATGELRFVVTSIRFEVLYITIQ